MASQKIYEVEIDGKVYEVDAPSIEAATQAAQNFKPNVEDIDADAVTQQASSVPGVVAPKGAASVAGVISGQIAQAEPVRRGARAATRAVASGATKAAANVAGVGGGIAGATLGGRVGSIFGTPFGGATGGATVGSTAGRGLAGIFERFSTALNEGLGTKGTLRPNQAFVPAEKAAELAEEPYRRHTEVHDRKAQTAKKAGRPYVAAQEADEAKKFQIKQNKVGVKNYSRTRNIRDAADTVFGKAVGTGRKLATGGLVSAAGKMLGPAGIAYDMYGELQDRAEEGNTLGDAGMFEELVQRERAKRPNNTDKIAATKEALSGLDEANTFTGPPDNLWNAVSLLGTPQGGGLLQRVVAGARNLMPRLARSGEVVRSAPQALPAGPAAPRQLPAGRPNTLLDAPSRQASMMDEIASRADDQFMQARGPAMPRVQPALQRTAPMNAVDDVAENVTAPTRRQPMSAHGDEYRSIREAGGAFNPANRQLSPDDLDELMKATGAATPEAAQQLWWEMMMRGAQ